MKFYLENDNRSILVASGERNCGAVYILCPTDTRDPENPTSLGGSIIAGIAVPAVIAVAFNPFCCNSSNHFCLSEENKDAPSQWCNCSIGVSIKLLIT